MLCPEGYEQSKLVILTKARSEGHGHKQDAGQQPGSGQEDHDDQDPKDNDQSQENVNVATIRKTTVNRRG